MLQWRCLMCGGIRYGHSSACRSDDHSTRCSTADICCPFTTIIISDTGQIPSASPAMLCTAVSSDLTIDKYCQCPGLKFFSTVTLTKSGILGMLDNEIPRDVGAVRHAYCCCSHFSVPLSHGMWKPR